MIPSMEGSVIEWVVLTVSLGILVATVVRSGLAGSTREPLAFIAIGLTCGSLRGALDLSETSGAGLALLIAEMAAVIFAFYLLWRRAKPRDPDGM